MICRRLVGPTFMGLPSIWAAACRRRPVVVAAAAAAPGSQDHYAVLGLSSRASSADIKRAYRLLALKYHPDVSKDLQSAEVFKSIRLAYDVLSDETARLEYDNSLMLQEGSSNPWGRARNGTDHSEFDEGSRIYRWDELRRRMQYAKCRHFYNSVDEDSSDDRRDAFKEDKFHEREPFSDVLRFTFFTLFLVQTLGTQISLTLCSIAALVDKQLDAGYKLGYLVAWLMGGRGGILLTLCLSFTSWLCGKNSSSLVVLVVVAMWLGANLARFAPLPHGALITLFYLSIKLQADL